VFPELQGNEELLAPVPSDQMPWTYKFDWQTKQLLQGLDGRYLKTETYDEYLQETARKIINTKRFQYGIYSDRVGVDFLSDTGKMRPAISLPAIKLDVQDALEAHDEIEHAEVSNVRFEKDRVVFSIKIDGVRGPTQTEVEVWQR